MPFLMAGLAVANGIMGFMSASSAAQAQSMINKANADAQNTVRKADNEFKGAATGLANYIRSEDNKRKFKMAGAEYNAAGQNIVRLLDQSIKGQAQTRIQSAEALGAMAAQASFQGIGGSTVDSINNQVRAAANNQSAEQASQTKYQVSDMRAQKLQLFDNANAASDQGTSFSGLDYSKNMPEFVAKPSFLTFALQAASNAMPYIRTGLDNSQMNNAQNASQNRVSVYGYNNYGSNLKI